MEEGAQKLNNKRISPGNKRNSKQQTSGKRGTQQQEEIKTSVRLRQGWIADKKAATGQMSNRTGKDEGNVRMKLVLPKQEVATIETKTKPGETKLEKRGREKQRGEEARNTPLGKGKDEEEDEGNTPLPPSRGEVLPISPLSTGEGKDSEKETGDEGDETEKRSEEGGQEQNKQEQQQTKPPATQAGLPTGHTTPQDDGQQAGETSEKERANALKSQKQQSKTAGQREAGKEKGQGERGKDKSRLKLPKEGSLTERAQKLAQMWMRKVTQQCLARAWEEVIFTSLTFVGVFFALIGYFYITFHYACYYLGQMKSVFARPQTLLQYVGLAQDGLINVSGGSNSASSKTAGLLAEVGEVTAWGLITVFIFVLLVIFLLLILSITEAVGWLFDITQTITGGPTSEFIHEGGL